MLKNLYQSANQMSVLQCARFMSTKQNIFSANEKPVFFHSRLINKMARTPQKIEANFSQFME